jgi:hypothetical protein
MRLGLPMSRQGLPTIAHRFIGGFRHALGMQPREGRKTLTRWVVTQWNGLFANRKILPSLTGLIGLAPLTPTVETVGYCRVSLMGQRLGDRRMRSHAC